MNPTVLVAGATGKFGKLVVPELVKRKAQVRALIRDASQEPLVRSLGASEVVRADLGHPDTLAPAVAGTNGVFFIGPAFAPDESTMGVALVEAATRGGVRKFVYSSVIQPTNATLKNHASKIPVETALYNSRLDYTILHPANFMQNIAFAWAGIIASGTFAEPFPATARLAKVDYRDVAETAAIALTGDSLSYATLELSAGMYDRIEIAKIISEELGRPIEAAEVSFDAWVAKARLPYDEQALALLAKVHAHYRAFGLGGNALTLKAALGREPRSMRTYIRDLIAAQSQSTVSGARA
ncbi:MULTISPECIES: NmrA family NAD(P)-binding protein [unclassified Beijerinckia]|uniref:NmrA family NAD(P)-binding protein n=1 Tax=unclassified Beijerinckia TaxID=2638183 RepID=UPI001FCCC537|nr:MULTISPECIES: NmrA family NAD(P)-binding protein [unclassified Beijerinckia]